MFLGIDLGTSELKLLLLDDAQRIVGSAGTPMSVSRPQPLWSEQHPDQWWSALLAASAQLRAAQPRAWSAVRAIGLSGQMHGAVLLDAAGDVLRPAILWNDGRSTEACVMLEHNAPRLRAIAGNAAMPGFTAPKLCWLREHEPEVFERTTCVLLPKDWLRWRLSGERFADVSDASGTLWLDVAQRRWSGELLAACGLDVEHMPTLVEGNALAGRLRSDIARELGLRAGLPIAGGGGDNAASAVGIGAVQPGQGFISLGTSGVIFVVADRYAPNPERAVHMFCHALPARWHQMSVMLSAASALKWALQLTGAANEAHLLDEAQALGVNGWRRAPIFLPYLGGERTPHNDATLQASLIGLTHEHGRAHVAQAVIEGVAFGLHDGWHSLDASLRARTRELCLVGGGARSAHWARLLASVLQLPLVVPEGGEMAAALGAARLAWLADGGDEADVCGSLAARERHEPQHDWVDWLQPRLQRFHASFDALQGSAGGAR